MLCEKARKRHPFTAAAPGCALCAEARMRDPEECMCVCACVARDVSFSSHALASVIIIISASLLPIIAWYRLSHLTLHPTADTVCVDTDATLLPMPLCLECTDGERSACCLDSRSRGVSLHPSVARKRENERQYHGCRSLATDAHSHCMRLCVCLYRVRRFIHPRILPLSS